MLESLRSQSLLPAGSFARRNLIVVIWLVSCLILAWLIVQGNRAFESYGTPVAIAIMAVCALALAWWIPNPIPRRAGERATRRGLLILACTVAASLLLLVLYALGRNLTFILPVMAITILFWIRQRLDRLQLLYASVLALVAGLAGANAGWIDFISPFEWGLLQIPLTLFSLLAGWAMLQATGLAGLGVGRSFVLTERYASAARGFAQGVLLGLPWALAAIVMGSGTQAADRWVRVWYQPFAALDAGIAEEAWGRVLLVPLVFLLLRRWTRDRAAFTLAILIVGYWFAYLHTFDQGNVLSVLFSTLFIGTLTALPLSRITLYRDLETGIGFHFIVDFLQFAWVLLL